MCQASSTSEQWYKIVAVGSNMASIGFQRMESVANVYEFSVLPWAPSMARLVGTQ